MYLHISALSKHAVEAHVNSIRVGGMKVRAVACRAPVKKKKGKKEVHTYVQGNVTHITESMEETCSHSRRQHRKLIYGIIHLQKKTMRLLNL